MIPDDLASLVFKVVERDEATTECLAAERVVDGVRHTARAARHERHPRRFAGPACRRTGQPRSAAARRTRRRDPGSASRHRRVDRPSGQSWARDRLPATLTCAAAGRPRPAPRHEVDHVELIADRTTASAIRRFHRRQPRHHGRRERSAHLTHESGCYTRHRPTSGVSDDDSHSDEPAWVHRHRAELTFTGKGHPRFYCRVGIEQHRKEVDGSFTKLDPVYCDLVLFDRAAERAYPKFKPGDQIIASGYIHEYEQERPGGPSEIRQQFVARRIGHDCARTRYVVDRTPANSPTRRPTR